jgi:hypothetical protein
MNNVIKARASGAVRVWRCHDESVIIRQLIQQWAVEPEPKLSGRSLARKLGVWEGYVRRLRKAQITVVAQRVSWDDLDSARAVTESLRLVDSHLFAIPRVPRPRVPRATPALAHVPGCECANCVCPKCRKSYDGRTAAGHIFESNRCVCVQHAESCTCAGCLIGRAIGRTATRA